MNRLIDTLDFWALEDDRAYIETTVPLGDINLEYLTDEELEAFERTLGEL